MQIKNTVIITADYQERYISEAINSCIFQKKIKTPSVIVVFSYLKNELDIKNKFRKYKNIIFLKKKRIKILSTQDQIYKIGQALKMINSGNIYLLDGDDLFHKNKIFFLQNKLNNSEYLIFNNFKVFNNYKTYRTKPYKKYKTNFLYKKLFNNWPDKISTSSISISYKLLNMFYKKNNPFLWKYLAIDAQLAIFFQINKQINYTEKYLTFKRIHTNNLDQTYSNIFSKIYWARRIEQHNFYKKKSNIKIYFSIDYFLTKIIFFITRI